MLKNYFLIDLWHLYKNPYMTSYRHLILLLLLCLSTLACTYANREGKSTVPKPTEVPFRTVAVTIDDLPVQRGGDNFQDRRQITRGLLNEIRPFNIPVTGFVNEVKLGDPARPEETALLRAWLDAGLDLGNHTYSHLSLFNTPLEAFEQEVLRGQEVTGPLMKNYGKTLKYFRHPYLNTGPDSATKEAFETFLTEQEYRVAPVTIDNSEWIYAFAYKKAMAAQDTELMSQIGDDYIRYMETMFNFFEQLSVNLLKREPAQVLLIHANALNANYFGKLFRMMQKRGYRFVSLDEALRDPVYALPDRYIGEQGISWLQRWWITRGNAPASEPEVSEWVKQLVFADQ